MNLKNGYVIMLDATMPKYRRWQWRFPRSKKRRIRNKWRAVASNWRSCAHVVQHTLMLGANAAARYQACDIDKMPITLSMHPQTWELHGHGIRGTGAKIEFFPP